MKVVDFLKNLFRKNFDKKNQIEKAKKSFFDSVRFFNDYKEGEYKTFLGALSYNKFVNLDINIQNKIKQENNEIIEILKKQYSLFITNVENDKTKNKIKDIDTTKFDLFERPSSEDLLFIDNTNNLYAIDIGLRTIPHMTNCDLFNKDRNRQVLELTTDYGIIDGEYEFEHETIIFYKDFDCIVMEEKDKRYITYNVSGKLKKFDSKYRERYNLLIYSSSLQVLAKKYNYDLHLSDKEKQNLQEIEKKEKLEEEKKRKRMGIYNNFCDSKHKYCIIKITDKTNRYYNENLLSLLKNNNLKIGATVTDSEGNTGEIIEIDESTGTNLIRYLIFDENLEKIRHVK